MSGLTDENLVLERPANNGTQRLYRVGKFGVSMVNASILHRYPFAWEAAVLEFDSPTSLRFKLISDTPLTTDGEVFMSDAEANRFLTKSFRWMKRTKRNEY